MALCLWSYHLNKNIESRVIKIINSEVKNKDLKNELLLRGNDVFDIRR